MANLLLERRALLDCEAQASVLGQRGLLDSADLPAAVVDKLRGIGFDVRAQGPEGLAGRVRKEVPMWRDVIVQSCLELQ